MKSYWDRFMDGLEYTFTVLYVVGGIAAAGYFLIPQAVTYWRTEGAYRAQILKIEADCFWQPKDCSK